MQQATSDEASQNPKTGVQKTKLVFLNFYNRTGKLRKLKRMAWCLVGIYKLLAPLSLANSNNGTIAHALEPIQGREHLLFCVPKSSGVSPVSNRSCAFERYLFGVVALVTLRAN